MDLWYIVYTIFWSYQSYLLHSMMDAGKFGLLIMNHDIKQVPTIFHNRNLETLFKNCWIWFCFIYHKHLVPRNWDFYVPINSCNILDQIRIHTTTIINSYVIKSIFNLFSRDKLNFVWIKTSFCFYLQVLLLSNWISK